MMNPYTDASQHPFRAVFGPVIWWRSYTRLLYLLLALPLGVLYFTVYVTGLSLGIGLLIMTIGAVILVALMLASRPIAHFERMLAVGLVGETIPPIPAPRTAGPGFWKWLAGTAGDSVTWKTLAFALLRFPLGLVSWVLVVVLVSLALGLIAAPVIEPLGGEVDFGVWSPTTAAELGAVSLIGLAAFVIVIHIVNGLAVAWGKLARLAVTRGVPPTSAPALPAADPGPTVSVPSVQRLAPTPA
jgi:hypothetical protein